jgi:hypothetical protein
MEIWVRSDDFSRLVRGKATEVATTNRYGGQIFHLLRLSDYQTIRLPDYQTKE